MFNKSRILAFLRKTTIARRLLALFLIQTFIILLWCGYMVKSSVSDFRDSLRFHNSQIISSISHSVDQAAKELNLATKIPVLQAATGSSQIFTYLSEIQNRQPNYLDYYHVNDDITNILSVYDDISTVCVADTGGSVIYVSDQKPLYYTASVATDSAAWQRVMEEKGGLLLMNAQSVSISGLSAPENGLWGARTIIGTSPFKPIGALFCCINMDRITESFYTGKTYSEQRIGIYDESGVLLAGDMDFTLEKGSPFYESMVSAAAGGAKQEIKMKFQGQTSIFQYGASEGGFITVIETPYNLILSDISRHQIGLYLLLIFLFLSIIIITRLLVSSIQAPISTLKQACDAMKQENFSIEIKDSAHDEMHDLIHSFNTMSEKIHYLIQEVYRKDTLQAQTELQMLRSQINPHFMYNTLETIRAAALSQHNPQLARMVSLLGKTLRYGVSTPSEPVTLSQEINNLYDYIELQNIHFEGRLIFNINIEEQLKDCIIIKLLLQPLVENAIYHGVGVTDQQGVIDIFGFTDGSTLTFKVADNGIGIDENELELLNDYINHKNECYKSIGLRNVNRRIKLYYGDSYGLHLDSVLGRGTVITIEIPLITGEMEAEL